MYLVLYPQGRGLPPPFPCTLPLPNVPPRLNLLITRPHAIKLFKKTLVRNFDQNSDGVLDSKDIKIMLSRCCPCLTRIFNHIISSQKVLLG